MSNKKYNRVIKCFILVQLKAGLLIKIKSTLLLVSLIIQGGLKVNSCDNNVKYCHSLNC
jgi:hypothetical protein